MDTLSFQDIVNSILEQPPRLGPVRMVAVDGRSGSGKSTFAARLTRAAVRDGVDVALVRTDDLLDGWSHPTGFDERLRRWIVDPLRAGRPAAYRRYDWHAERFGVDWCHVGTPDVLILEGVTIAAARWRPMTSFAVLLRADPELCRARGIERDGEELRHHFEQWHRDEDAHFAREPGDEVELIVAGDLAPPNDPELECVVIGGSHRASAVSRPKPEPGRER